jgi:hypothetical protein
MVSTQINQFCLPVMRWRGRLNLVTAIDSACRLPTLRACASGIRPLEAGTSLLMDCGGWLRREDFARRFIISGSSVSDGTARASIDWEVAITALDAGRLPGGGGDAASCGWPRASPGDTG